MSLPNHAVFELRFKGSTAYQLAETRFRFTPKDTTAILRNTNNKSAGFQWSAGVKGLSVLIILHVLNALGESLPNFQFSGPVYDEGERRSLPSSLGQSLGKKPIWVQQMFLSDTTDLSEVIDKIFSGTNLEGKNKNRDVAVGIKPARLSVEDIKIYLNGSPVETVADLKSLLIKLEGVDLPETTRDSACKLVEETPTPAVQESVDLNSHYAAAFETFRRNSERAEKWPINARRVAADGDLTAQLYLGFCCEDGEGIDRDLTEAIRWYRKAAKQNDVRANYRLGILFSENEEVVRDEEEAMRCFLLAAEQGFVRAQYKLGLLYAKLKDEEIGLVQSYKWLTIASANGHLQADDELEKIKHHLTPKQIHQATQLVKSFHQPEQAIGESSMYPTYEYKIRDLKEWQDAMAGG